MNAITHTITEILEETKKSLKVKTDKSGDRYFWVKKKNIKNNRFVRYAPIELDKFWKDVDSRVGMDVCIPFIEKFPGHSFVAYDNGLIWSKTMKRGFLTRNAKVSLNSYPKAMIGRPFGFGSDLSELNKIIAI